MPIGYPRGLSVYLAKRQGPFATLGLAEDTWAAQRARPGRRALPAAMHRHRPRTRGDVLRRPGQGAAQGCASCVFDGTDRMQHMFWRVPRRRRTRPGRAPRPRRHATSIEDLYRRMDDLVGRTMAKCDGEDTLLMVISDHGFNTFRRGIDLNRWLEENGYLSRRRRPAQRGVSGRRRLVADAGVRHRPDRHLPQPRRASTRRASSSRARRPTRCARRSPQKLDDAGRSADRRRAPSSACTQAAKVYRGPYKDQAPDLIVGYAARLPRVVGDGHRPDDRSGLPRQHQGLERRPLRRSVGRPRRAVLQPRRSRPSNPRLLDIGPTVLRLFGVPVPDHMDGKPLTIGRRAAHEPLHASNEPDARRSRMMAEADRPSQDQSPRRFLQAAPPRRPPRRGRRRRRTGWAASAACRAAPARR